jgi:type I restriction enzyme R subunit
MNLRNALSNASFIGFTGTPLFKDDEITKRIFGDYVSVTTLKEAWMMVQPFHYTTKNRGEYLGFKKSRYQ